MASTQGGKRGNALDDTHTVHASIKVPQYSVRACCCTWLYQRSREVPIGDAQETRARHSDEYSSPSCAFLQCTVLGKHGAVCDDVTLRGAGRHLFLNPSPDPLTLVATFLACPDRA